MMTTTETLTNTTNILTVDYFDADHVRTRSGRVMTNAKWAVIRRNMLRSGYRVVGKPGIIRGLDRELDLVNCR